MSEVKDGMPVAPDHVYVMPRNTSMAIEGGALRLRPREKGRGQHRPIDAFLRTLAEDQNARAIGVILSGTATDGTLGLEAVKAEGGSPSRRSRNPPSTTACRAAPSPPDAWTSCSRPKRSPKNSRASAAIPTSPRRNREPGEEEAAQPAVKNGFNKILALLRRVTGVDFSLYKTQHAAPPHQAPMILNKLDGLEEYAEYLRENASEVENLYQDILINVTSFFRDPEAFEVLKGKSFPGSSSIARRTSR